MHKRPSKTLFLLGPHKGKVVPIRGVEAYRWVEALDRHEWSASLSGYITPVLTEQETGSAPKPVWTLWKRYKSVASVGIQTTYSPARSQVTIPTELSRILRTLGPHTLLYKKI
jgi:hypothetical protein